MVFIDESGVNTDMTRNYGRSVGKKRVVDHTPLNTPKNTTMISSVRLNGDTAFSSQQGAMTGEDFKKYLKDILLPTLKEGDIVIMDNLRCHKVKGVKELIKSVGASLVYLPPYSPDFNPIEKMWSKIKAILRKYKIRNANFLPEAIKKAFSFVTDSDCRGWFTCAGY